MAYLFRLIFSFLLFSVSAAHASFPAPQYMGNSSWTLGLVFGPASTPEAICSLHLADFNSKGRGPGPNYFSYTLGAVSPTSCRLNRSDGGFSLARIYKIPAQCPSNSTINNGECTCNSGHKENSEGNACMVWTDADQERAICKGNEAYWNSTLSWGDSRRVVLDGQQNTGKITCNPAPGMPPGRGCTAEFQLEESTKNNDGKTWTSWGTAKWDEDVTLPCSLVPNSDGTSNDPPITEIREKPCPFGQPGQINGVDVCVPMKDESKTESRKVTQDEKILPDGSKEVTTTTTTTNCKDRMCMTVTDKKVSSTPGMVTNPPPGGGGPEVPPGGKKLPDGSVWSPTGPTTTTGAGSMGGAGGVTPPAGAASGAGSNTGSAGVLTESKSDFCTKSPKDKQCGQQGDGQGGFGGSCKAGFKCDGDAVTCAIAQEAHKRNCQLFETESDERTAYLADLAKGKEGKDNSKDLKGNVERTFSSADFDTSDALGGGACIGDKTVTVMGETIVLPFSMICQILSYMGTVLVGVSYLLAARIVIRG